MGIKTTITIIRQQAIERIRLVHEYIDAKNYLELSEIVNEPNYDCREFIDLGEDGDFGTLDFWTNDMLEELIDTPFFRFSMFDNYEVVD